MASPMVLMAIFFLLWRVRCTSIKQEEKIKERGAEEGLVGKSMAHTIGSKSGSSLITHRKGHIRGGESGGFSIPERIYASGRSGLTSDKQEEGGERGGGRGLVEEKGTYTSMKNGSTTSSGKRGLLVEKNGTYTNFSSNAPTSPRNRNFSSNETKSSTSFPAYFVFGDSLADVGNNNFIITVAKANSLPFGIDFPSGPTGRFTNGKIVPDFLCERFGLPFPPPYLAPTTRGPALLKGVNYASAASGILRSTGYNFIGRVDFDTQLEWFAKNIQDLTQLLGDSRTQELLATSLFSIITGSNDYINNYLLATSPLPLKYSPEEFQELLLNKLSSQLRQLYILGARKVIIANIGPIGCIPSQIAKIRSKNGECSDMVNNLAISFNQGLNSLVQNLNGQLIHTSFIVIDTFAPVLAFHNTPYQYGFKFVAEACCGAGLYKGQIVCLPIVTPCMEREDYVFWDPYHPTERAYRILANDFYKQIIRFF